MASKPHLKQVLGEGLRARVHELIDVHKQHPRVLEVFGPGNELVHASTQHVALVLAAESRPVTLLHERAVVRVVLHVPSLTDVLREQWVAFLQFEVVEELDCVDLGNVLVVGEKLVHLLPQVGPRSDDVNLTEVRAIFPGRECLICRDLLCQSDLVIGRRSELRASQPRLVVTVCTALEGVRVRNHEGRVNPFAAVDPRLSSAVVMHDERIRDEVAIEPALHHSPGGQQPEPISNVDLATGGVMPAGDFLGEEQEWDSETVSQ
mmetsp:Transcript_16334/g.51691  ORF Transcript_16334/g.51691 Transcript_16334/m.51691 type:complete len:263 (+) Transcript_16334:475-1263(+)